MHLLRPSDAYEYAYASIDSDNGLSPDRHQTIIYKHEPMLAAAYL